MTTISSSNIADRTINIPLAGGNDVFCLKNVNNCAGTNFWQVNGNALAPLEDAYDLLLGSNATTSAKIAFINVSGGTPTASISANSGNNNTFLTGAGNLGTTNSQTLTLGGSSTGNIVIDSGSGLVNINDNTTINGTLTLSGGSTDITTGVDEDLTLSPNGTGNLILASDSDTSVLIGSASTPAPLSIAGGIGGNAALIVDQLNSGDIFTASASGVTRFSVTNTGDLVIGDDGSSFFVTLTPNTLDQDRAQYLPNEDGTLCIQGSLACGFALGVNYFQLNNNLLSPINSTYDFAIGGDSTTSASFAVVGVADGAPIATLAASTNNNGIYLDSSTSTIQSLLNNTLTIGGDSTGNILLSPGNGAAGSILTTNAETVNLTNTTTLNGTSLTAINGGATAINFDEFSVDASTGSVTIDDNADAGYLSVDGTVLDINSLTFAGTGDIITTGDATVDSSTNINLDADGGNIILLDNGTEFGRFTNTGTSLVIDSAGTATTIADDLTITGGDITNISLNFGNGSAATLGTVSDDNLTLSPNGTGNLILASDSDTSVLIGSASTPAPLSIAGGIGGNAALIVDQLNSGDIFTASASGVTRFSVTNTGDLVIGDDGSSFFVTLTPNTLDQDRAQYLPNEDGTLCIQGSLACGFALGVNYFQLNNNLLSPINSTYDFAIGGDSTTSASFAVVGVADGAPIATLAASTNNNGIYLDSSTSTIQSLLNNTLTIGGDSTGDIVLAGRAGADDSLVLSGYLGGALLTDVNGRVTAGILPISYGGSPFEEANGSIFERITSQDFLLGGVTTTSAQFAVTGINDDSPVATLSGSTNNGISLSADTSTIQSLLNNTLTIGGDSTGNILLSPGNGAAGSILTTNAETVNLTNTTTLNGTSLTAINGGATAINFDEFSVDASTGSVTIDDNADAGYLSIDGTVLDINSLTFAGAGDIITTGDATVDSSTNINLDADGGNIILLDNGTEFGRFTNTGTSLVIDSAGTATTIADDLTITGGDITNISLNFGNGSAATLGTVSDDNLTLSPNGTGNLILASDSDTSVLIGSASTPAPLSIAGGIGGNAALIVDQLNSGDIFTASASGVTRFSVTNTGDLVIGDDGSSFFVTLTPNTLDQDRAQYLPNEDGTLCIQGSLACGFALGVNYFQLNNNLLSPINSTYDFAIGGDSTTSASFAVVGVADGAPIATLAASTNNNGIYLDSSTSTIQSLLNNTLTIGGDSTGDIVLAGRAGADDSLVLSGYLGGALLTDVNGRVTAGILPISYGGSPFEEANGSIFERITSQDFLLGGVTTTSAQFAVTGINDDSPVATLSGSTNNGISLSADTSTIQSLLNNTLTIGGDSTGNILLSPGNGAAGSILTTNAETVNLTNTTTLNGTSLTAINGGATAINFDEFSVDASTGSVTIDDNADAGYLSIDGTVLDINSLDFVGAGDITTGTDTNLSLTPGGNGLVGIFTSSPLSTLDVRSNSGTLSIASISGSTSNAALLVNQTGVSDIFTASASGVTRFSVTNTGDLVIGDDGSSFFVTLTPNTLDQDRAQYLPNEDGTLCIQGSLACGFALGVNYFQLNNNLLSPINSTYDFAIGGDSSTSAKFAILNIAETRGNQIASLSGNIVLDNAASIQTTNNQTLTLGGTDTGNILIDSGSGLVTLNDATDILGNTNITGILTLTGASTDITTGTDENLTLSPNGTGNLILASDSNTSVLIGSASTPAPLSIAGGIGGNSALIVDQLNSGDIFTASASGVTRFAISNDGTLRLYGSTSGFTGIVAPSTAGNNTLVLPVDNGSSGQALITDGSGNLSWTNVSTGYNPWDAASGAIYPKIESYDLLVGGQSTESATFAILNNSGTRGTQVASLSGDLVLDSAGSIQTTNNQTLTLGGDTTGNILLDGVTSINGATDITGTLDVSGLATFDGGLTVSDGQTLTANGVVNLGDGGDAITIDGSSSTVSLDLGSDSQGDIFYRNNSGNLTRLAIGGANQCLLSGGTTPTWGDCALGTNYFQLNNNLLSPINSTYDFAIGGDSTTSASFAVVGVADGNPIATLAASTNNNGISLDSSTSTIQSLLNNTLTIGGSTTGDIELSTANADGIILSGYGTGILHSDSNGRLTSSAVDLASSDVTGILPVVNGGSPFEELNGSIFERITTQDLLIGGTSTDSAKFAVLNVNTNTPVASVSAQDANGYAIYLDPANGSLQTTNNQTLTLGGDTTGNILLDGVTSINGATDITGTLDVSGLATFDGGLTVSDGQTLTANGVVNLGDGGDAITIDGSSSTVSLDLGSDSQGDIFYRNNSGNLTRLAIGGANQCLLSGGTTPTWGDCALGVNYFQLNGNLLSPINSTYDFAIGGDSSTSAKFAILNIAETRGNQIASLSGNIVLDNAASIQTTNNQTLTLGGTDTGNILIDSGSGLVTLNDATDILGNTNITGILTLTGASTDITTGTDENLTLSPNGTGNLILASDSNTSVLIGSASTPAPLSIAGGIGGNSALIVDQLNSGDIFTASASGVTRFAISNDGTLRLYGSTSGFTGIVAPSTAGNNTLVLPVDNGSSGQALITDGSGNLSWTNVSTGYNPWDAASGAIYPKIESYDLLVGGQSTESATFAILNNSGTRGTQVASLSGDLVLDSAGSIQTTNNQTLTLGGDTTGNILLDGVTSINGATDITGTLDVSGLATFDGGLTVSDGQTLTANGVVNLGDGGDAITIDGSSSTVSLDLGSDSQGDIFYRNNSGNLTRLAIGGANQCLLSGGTTPTWGDCALGVNYFQLNGNLLSPINSTYDFAIGGDSTTSASFAVVGVADGNPIATLAASTNNNGISLDSSTSTIQSLLNNTLTIGGSTTGDIELSTANADGIILSGYGTGILHSDSNGRLTSSAVDLASSDVTGILPVVNGGSPFEELNGSIFERITTQDLLIGGTSTDSAKFAVLNVNTNTPVASVSAQDANGYAIYLDPANGSLQTTNNQTLTLGGDTTGNILLDGVTSINGATDITGTLDVSGLATFDGGLTVSDGQTLTANGVVNLGDGGDAITIDGSSSTVSLDLGSDSQGDIFYRNNSGNLTRLAIGGANQCLLSGGTTPTWGDCALGVNYFQLNGNLLSPINSTYDFAIGGDSTTSASFAVVGVADGNPIATLAASTNNNGISLDSSTSTIQSLLNNTLTIGGDSTGDIELSTANADGIILSGYGTGILHSDSNGRLTSSAVDLASSDVTGILPVVNGGSPFEELNGSIFERITTQDLLIGGTSTDSAKFAVLNVNTNTPVASVSAQDANGYAIYLDPANGSLQTTNNQTLTLGGDTTGNILLDGVTSINGATDITGTLDVSGLATFDGGLTVSDGQTLTANGVVNLGDGGDAITIDGSSSTVSLDLGSDSQGDIFYRNNSGNLTRLAIGGANQCLLSGGTTPTWGDCALGVNYFQLNGNLLSPINSTYDFAIGGDSSTSAKFAILNIAETRGNQIASLSGNIVLDNAASIQTTNNQTLTLGGTDTGNILIDSGSGLVTLNDATDILGNTNITGILTLTGASTDITTGTDENLTLSPNGTGNLILASDSNTSVLIGSASTPAPLSIAGGIGGNSALIVDQLNSGDIFTASASGVTRFAISNDGTLRLYGSTSGFTGIVAPSTAGNNTLVLPVDNGSSGQALITDGSGNLSWTNVSTGYNPWDAASGAIYPKIESYDLLVGGQSTESATFAILNNSGTRGTQVASLSGDLVLDSAGSIQTTNNQTLTLGGDTTGNILLDGVTSINGATDITGTLDVSGLATFDGGLTVSDGQTLTANGVVTLGDGGDGITLNGSGITLTGYNNCNALNTNGTGDLGCNTSTLSLGTNLWTLSTDGTSITPINQTYDFLLGGDSTTSANFAVTGLASDSPTATLAAGTGNGLVLTSDGTIQSLQNQTLTLGGDTTGNILLDGVTSINGATDITGTLDVSGLATFDGGLTVSDGQTLTANGVVTLGDGGDGITLNGSGITLTGYNNCNALNTNGTGDLGCNTSTLSLGTNLWTLSTDGTSITPINQTYDFLLGGDSTTSANFAVTGLASDSPTATLAAGTGNGLVLTSDGTIQSLQNQTLTLGGDTTGNILLDGVTSINGATDITGTLDVSGLATFDGGLTVSDGQTLTANGVVNLGDGGDGITLNGSGITLTGYNNCNALNTNGTGDLGCNTSTLSLGTNLWTLSTDGTSITPINQTYDFLLGGDSTTSANFAVTGLASDSPTATLAAGTGNGLVLTSDGTIQSLQNQTLTLGGDTTGNILLDGVTSINGATDITGTLDVSGLATFDGGLTVSDGQTLTANGVVTLGDGGDGITLNGSGITLTGYNNCNALNTNGTGDLGCNTSTLSLGTNLWTLSTDGTSITPINQTYDFLLGGDSTTSANFAVTGLASDSPTATLAAGTGNGLVLTSDGTIQSLQNQTLTLGGDTTGNILLDGVTSINGATDITGTLDVSGLATFDGGLTVSDGQTLTANGVVTLGDGGDGITLNGSGITLTGYNNCNALNTNGTGDLGCNTSTLSLGTNLWTLSTDGTSITPINQTYDFLLGGDSTTSANFAVTGLASDSPTATLAAGTGNGLVLTSDGTIQSLQNQTLTLGGDTTGNILLDGVTSINGATDITGTLDVSGLATFDGGLTVSDGQTLTANGVVTLGDGGDGITLNGSGITLTGYNNCNALNTNGTGDLGCNTSTLSLGTNLWTLSTDGTSITPINQTYDFLLGGDSTTSANFAVTGLASDSPTATLAAGTGNGLVLTSDGTIQSLQNQTLTLGGDTTGNILLDGVTSINGATDITGTLDVSGLATFDGGLTVSDGQTLTANGVVTLGDGGDGITLNGSGITLTGYNNCNALNTNGTGDLGCNTSTLSLGTNLWTLSTDGTSITPINQTYDFLLGGDSTTSANFAVTGLASDSPTATLAGSTNNGISLSADTSTIQSLLNNTLTIGGDSTGDIVLTPLNGSGDVRINGTTTLNNLTYTWPGSISGNDYVLQTQSNGTLSWVNPTSLGTNYWDQINGVLTPKIETQDLLIGGTSTDSAKFAVLNVNTNTPVASVSAQDANGYAIYLDPANGSLQTTNNQTLTLGGDTTGNILLDGVTSINGATDITGTLDVSGLATFDGGLTVSDGQTLTANGVVTLGDGGDGITLNGSGITLTGYNNCNALNTNGTGVLGCNTSTLSLGTNLWTLSTDGTSITPINQTYDFLLGGDSTTSANFAVTGLASDSPTATLAGSTNNGISLSADTSTIQSLLNNTLTIGGDSTGDIDINGNTSITGTLDVSGVGTFASVTSLGTIDAQGDISDSTGNLTLNDLIDVSGLATFNGGVTIADGQTLAANGIVTLGDGGDAITLNGSGITLTGYTNDGGVLYTDSSGVLAETAAGLDTQCLFGGATPSWGDCAQGTILWDLNAGAISPTYADTIDFLLGGTATTSALFSITGINDGVANATINAQGDLRLADSDSSNYVALQAPTTVGSNYTLTLPNAVPGITGQALVSDTNGNLSWSTVATGYNAWDVANGSIYPKSGTYDLLVGGQSTSSAKFAILNQSTGATIATISATTNNNGLVLDAANSNIQSVRNNTLNIGGNTTGNVTINSDGQGVLSIGTTETRLITGNFAVITATGGAQFSSLTGAGLVDCNNAVDVLKWDADTKISLVDLL